MTNYSEAPSSAVKPLIRFQVISDIHVTTDVNHDFNRNFDRALKDIREHCPDSAGIMLVGDITDSGTEPEYDEMLRIWKENGRPKMLFTMGNHDVRWADWDDRRERFLRKTGMKGLYHDHWLEGYHFIFLGTEQGLKDDAYLSDVQLNWFEEKLAEGSDSRKPVFVFLHQPLKDGVAGSRDWHGVVQDSQMKSILAKYPQTILFTGHSHWELGSARTMYLSRYGTMLNTASVAYLSTDTEDYKKGSQGYYVEVYGDEVVVRGRDFASGSWLASAEYSVKYPVASPNEKGNRSELP